MPINWKRKRNAQRVIEYNPPTPVVGNKRTIKRPTKHLLGSARSALLHDDYWYTNGHWLLHVDIFSTKPRVPKGYEEKPLPQLAYDLMRASERDSCNLLQPTLEAYELTTRPGIDDETYVFQKFVFDLEAVPEPAREKAKERIVWIDRRYTAWLEVLAGIEWFAPDEDNGPVRVMRGMELLGLVMPARPPTDNARDANRIRYFTLGEDNR